MAEKTPPFTALNKIDALFRKTCVVRRRAELEAVGRSGDGYVGSLARRGVDDVTARLLASHHRRRPRIDRRMEDVREAGPWRP